MKWISVKEDTPEHCKDVVVLVRSLLSDGTECDYLNEYTGYISYRDRWLLNAPDSNRRGHTVDKNRVEYWMPLPKHPK
tara:strand:+ start:2485 stop:2718 length:234 start_codon:yes stop_codon:yes gene_type:complete